MKSIKLAENARFIRVEEINGDRFVRSRSQGMGRFLTACLTLASAFAAGSTSASTLAITHVNIIDATGSPPQRDMTVVVKDGRIVELGRSDAVHAPVDARAVDGS